MAVAIALAIGVHSAGAVQIAGVSSISIAEGDSGTVEAVFTITLAEAPASAREMTFETVAERATAGVDYVSRSGTVTFQPGDTSETVAITINGDTDYENEERFELRVTDPNAPAGEPGSGFATILNDEVAVVPADADILYQSDTVNGLDQVFAMNAQGQNRTQLTARLVGAEEPAASPSRDRFAFVGAESSTGDPEIFVAQANGTGIVQLTHNDVYDYGPTWSPDGLTIAFQQQVDAYTGSIHTVPADGGAERNLSPAGAADLRPSFSPDGTRIAFQSGNPYTSSSIWTMNADGTNRELITDLPGVSSTPSFSPDGSRIIYSAVPEYGVVGGTLHIFAVEATPGAAPVKVTEAGGPWQSERTHPYPIWSPDGKQVLFGRIPGGYYADIESRTVGGGPALNLTATPGIHESHPSWGLGIPMCQAAQAAVTDAAVTIPLSCTDTDGNPFTISIVDPPAHGTLVELDQAGSVKYVPETGFSGIVTFTYSATDADGRSFPATVRLTVTSSLPPQNTETPITQGGGPAPSTAPGCEVTRVLVGKWVAAASCFKRVGNNWSSQGQTIRLNGIDLHARGGDFVVDPSNKNIKFVGKGLDEASMALGGSVVLTDPRLEIDLRDDELSFGSLKALLLGFKIPGIAVVRITARPGGEASLTVPVSLPAPLDKVTGGMTLKTNMGTGPFYSELKLGESPIGAFTIKDLLVSYHFETNRFIGTGRFILPTPKPYDAAARIEFVNGKLIDLSASIGNLGVPVGQAVFLQRLRFNLKTNPLFFSGGAGFSAGPALEGKEIISIDGDLSYQFTTPGVFRVDGVVKIAGLNGITGYFQYLTNGYLSFGANLDWVLVPDFDLPFVGKVRGIGMKGTLDGFVEPNLFQAYGKAKVYASLFEYGGEAVVSSAGAAACGGWSFDVPLAGRIQVRVGMGYGFRTKVLSVMAPTCDVGPWTVRAVAAQLGPTVAIAPGASSSYRTVASKPSAAFAFVGRDGPPAITVSGPGGVSTSTVADFAQVKTNRMLIWQTPHDKTTYVFVAGPGAGPWKFAVAPTSTPVVEVRQAEGLPQPSVRARVSGRGHRRVLNWSLKAIPGQGVTFAEMGKGTAKALGKARGTSGRLRFDPADGRAGKRRIVAQITQGGMPRTQLTVARYNAPATRRPGRPSIVALRRRGTSLEIRWLRGSRATRYEIQVSVADGRTLMVRRADRSFRVPDVGRTGAARVSVTALDSAGRRSAARRASIGKWPKRKR